MTKRAATEEMGETTMTTFSDDDRTAVEQMVGTIRVTQGAVDFIGGGNSGVDAAAAEWVAAGFDTESAAAWWQAGAFDADRAAQMRDDGLTPDAVSVDCPKLEGCSWGYARCNGDCSRQDVIDACRI